MSEVETDKVIVDETGEVIELTEEQLDAILAELGEDDGLEPIEKIDRELFGERVIYLQGEVNENMVNHVVPLIHYYNILDEKYETPIEERSPIKIHINSVGGELYNGSVIQSAMLSSKTPVHAYSQGGVGMSMGLILFLSASRRYMSRFSNLMYHQLSAGSDVQTLLEMKNTIQHYERVQDDIDEYIVERTTLPMKKLKEKRKKNLDWFIDFKTAQKYGFFHEEI